MPGRLPRGSSERITENPQGDHNSGAGLGFSDRPGRRRPRESCLDTRVHPTGMATMQAVSRTRRQPSRSGDGQSEVSSTGVPCHRTGGAGSSPELDGVRAGVLIVLPGSRVGAGQVEDAFLPVAPTEKPAVAELMRPGGQSAGFDSIPSVSGSSTASTSSRPVHYWRSDDGIPDGPMNAPVNLHEPYPRPRDIAASIVAFIPRRAGHVHRQRRMIGLDRAVRRAGTAPSTNIELMRSRCYLAAQARPRWTVDR